MEKTKKIELIKTLMEFTDQVGTKNDELRKKAEAQLDELDERGVNRFLVDLLGLAKMAALVEAIEYEESPCTCPEALNNYDSETKKCCTCGKTVEGTDG